MPNPYSLKDNAIIHGLWVAALVPPAIVWTFLSLWWLYEYIQLNEWASWRDLVAIFIFFVVPAFFVSFLCAFSLGWAALYVADKVNAIRSYTAVVAGFVIGLIGSRSIPLLRHGGLSYIDLEYEISWILVFAGLGAAAGLSFWITYRWHSKRSAR